MYEKYFECVKDACNEIRFDYLPQVEASDLLYRIVSLEDIYLPLSLIDVGQWPIIANDAFYMDDKPTDELIHWIDFKSIGYDRAFRERMLKSGVGNRTKKEDATLLNQLLEEYEDLVEKLRLPYKGNKIDTVHGNSSTQNDIHHAGVRLLLEAKPGSGKTTFCKRLSMALAEHDLSFFSKYEMENDLYFNTSAIPVYVSCKWIADLSIEELQEDDFVRLLYKLSTRSLGTFSSCIREEDFHELFSKNCIENSCIILDGWDEIFDTNKERAFTEKIDSVISKHPRINLVITIRQSYVAPTLSCSYTDHCIIEPFSNDDILEFSKRWYDIILGRSHSHRLEFATFVAGQIIENKDQQIIDMRGNPLDLSLLLTVSKSEGKLPDNKADLFGAIVDLYIYWSINKQTSFLSIKTTRILLAYIASVFSKKGVGICSEREVATIIEQAFIDLDCSFSDSIKSNDVHMVAKELSHTGILTRTYGGEYYSFSESMQGTHRLMQEYLTAYAIQAQYSDEEYNDMSPADILYDKYNNAKWREIIVFLALMNDGRLRRKIVARLINLCKESNEEKELYEDLLFELIVSGADMQIQERRQIYDAIFQKRNKPERIAGIATLFENGSIGLNDFVEYIESRYVESVKKCERDYGDTWAVIRAIIAHRDKMSPAKYAEGKISSDNDFDIATGLEIYILLSRLKYSYVNTYIIEDCKNYRIPIKIINIIKGLLSKTRWQKLAFQGIRAIIVADFARWDDFFLREDALSAYENLVNSVKVSESELILSVVPVFEIEYMSLLPQGNGTIRHRYVNRLDDEIEKGDFENASFTFGICAVLGAYFFPIDNNGIWSRTTALYNKCEDVFCIGAARARQLEISFSKTLSGLMERITERANDLGMSVD